MLVEQPTGNQLTLHLAKLLTDLPSLGSVCPPLFKLVLGELPMTKVRHQDPRSTLFALCTSAGTAMQSAPAILLSGRTLTRGAPACLRTASLPRSVRPEPPLNADDYVVFCKHEYHPAYEVLLCQKLYSKFDCSK